MQRYIEMKFYSTFVIPKLPNYEFVQECDDDHEERKEISPKRKKLVSGDGSSDDPWIYEEDEQSN